MKRRGFGGSDGTFAALTRKLSRWRCQRCKEEGCELKYQTKSRGTRGLIVDCNRYPRENGLSGKIADCLFIEDADPLLIAVAELKSGGLDPEKSVGQIQATLSLADHLLSECRVEVSLPVLVHGKGLYPNDFKIIRHQKVAFRGLERNVVTARCGASLSDLLEQYASQYRVP